MTNADELVTKGDLAITRSDLRAEMAALRVEMHQMKSSLMVTLIGAMTAQTAILGFVFTLSN